MQPERLKLFALASRWLFPLSSSTARQSPIIATSCAWMHGGNQASRYFCSSVTPGSRDPHPPSSSSEPPTATKLESFSNSNTQSGSSPSLVNSTAAGWLRGPHGNGPSAQLEDEWEAMIDPATDKTVYRNLISGEITTPGGGKPHTWTTVVDKKTGLIYYWDKATGEVTVLGEGKPGPYGRQLSDDSSEREAKEAEERRQDPAINFLVLFNNPIGWLVLGLAIFGVGIQLFKTI